jgi:site-specific recombinase XerC
MVRGASLPADPDTVAAYLASCADAGLKAGSIQRRVSGIVAFHMAHGYASPAAGAEVKLTMAGIRRELGTRQLGKSPALTADVAAMVAKTPVEKILGVRDRALLLVGFAGAFRRSELVALNFEDVEFREDGLKVTIRKSKTDQEGAGQVIGISCGTKLCPVRALREWIAAANITSGPISVASIAMEIFWGGWLRRQSRL